MHQGLVIESLRVTVGSAQNAPAIVHGLSLDIAPGETLGLVGESGSGKTMTALAIMGLLPPGLYAAGGRIGFNGQNLLALHPARMRALRGSAIGMIFQEPMTALNPVFTIGRQVAEVFTAHQPITRQEAWQKAISMLTKVGLPDASARAGSYPHQLSGGLRQRVLIAMAMALSPALLLADEPTTALDVTIQAQILSLLKRLTGEEGSACLLITHNLAIVAQLANRVAIMYAGRLLELAATPTLLARPLHPYTQGLIACLPAGKTPLAKLPTIKGTVPPLTAAAAPACVFAPRCPHAFARCFNETPLLKPVAQGSQTACFLYDEHEHA